MRKIGRGLKLPTQPLAFYEKVWLLAPLALWFSFQPFIRLGQDSTMYFELSVALVYVLILALVGLPHIVKARRELLKKPVVWLASAYVGVMLLSLLWTPNPTRGLLTLGVTGLLYLVLLSVLARSVQMQRIVPALVRLYVGAAVVMSVIAIVQLVAGIWLSPDITLLCAGCVAEQFGFARPNVFAIEPQFFGSLLLAPLLVLTYRLTSGARQRHEVVSFLLVAAALFLTLSRGALFAWALGVVIVFVLNMQRMREVAKVACLIVAAFVLSLGIQGAAAALNPSVEESFSGAIVKVVNQLSLGVIDIPQRQPEVKKPVVEKPVKPNFDGYVEESTDVRVNRSTLAIQTWADSPQSVMLGVGVGGAGVAVHEKFSSQIGAREIVQNQYIETLLEQGIIGVGIFMSLLAGLVYAARRQRWLWAIIAAYMFQWLFFSGYPNALHIYAVLILVYLTVRRDPLAPATRY